MTRIQKIVMKSGGMTAFLEENPEARRGTVGGWLHGKNGVKNPPALTCALLEEKANWRK